ncbi:uncharacterized protein DUF3108 [Acidovorax sp. 107]|uniref:DUF3108 domain-containing protein n=1 Tax=Acidovorax sp. 107 TaxID=2135638 RepID=UPI000D35F2C8|nr:DUF3108 domain-containing protein [Acidovorax sp. 107]PUA98577.1 uncharacterized protein DUF3108 [Acidovorax sp. 107]
MPRRALVFITALVLALHWLVLSGVPLAWDSPAQPSSQVFSTRSIAPAPPPPTVAPAGVTAVPVAAPQTPPRKKAPSPKRPPAPAAQDRPELAPVAAPVVEAGTPADTGAATTVASATPETPTNDAAPAPAPAASVPATPPEPPAEDAQTGTGVDIRPPGGTGRSASASPPPVRMPAPTRLAFDVSGQAKKFAYSAKAELLWQHDGNRYEARQEISAFLVGTRTQRSVGTVTEQGLLPEKFSDKSRSEQAAHFDYAKGRVTFSANTPDAVAGPGVQDRLSLFIQLGAMLAADPGRFVPGTQITLTTVSARSADRWTFTVEGPETLDLPAGPTPALKLLRLPRKDYDQKAELWVAPGLGYLPVRIKLTQANGDFADLLLRASGPP